MNRGIDMTRSVIITQEENWYVAEDVGTGVTSQGETLDSAISNLQEALELYFDGTTDIPADTRKVFLTTVEVAV